MARAREGGAGVTMRVETKVKASTAAAAVSGLLLWVLGTYVFRGAVPPVLASWVYVAVPGVVTFVAGYLARHTDRAAVPPSGGGGGGAAT